MNDPVTTQSKQACFRELHAGPDALLLANAWDVGSARLFASLGFKALATTSSGYAATLGRPDGAATFDEVLQHCRDLVSATPLPVNADLENCFADTPDGVAERVRAAVETGVAGLSVEDFTRDPDSPIYEKALATDRVRAAVEAAHAGPDPVVVTGRAENYLHGRPDLQDTIGRLQAYQDAGADVLYAPGLTAMADIRAMLAAVDRPVNVLALPGVPPVADLAAAGVRRISVGGAFAFAAFGAAVQAGRELIEQGTYGYRSMSSIGGSAAAQAFQ